ncbi:MAG TPA: DEAD/DEAH box helicase, partial [Chitinophagaceae bacterium]|nr:DEAD/DEAH box helicase [Chitinophagaceae bacterium]
MFLLRNKPCVGGCAYCNTALDIHKGLKRFFRFDSYRTYGGEPLQEQAVKAAIDNKSILAVFPTGGGKSITFQVPALMSGENAKGLTVVISPLQSLMKDQVDNLEKNGIIDAVTINGLLDPIERAKSFERVEEGSASILYLSPESLRSRSIERLLLGRKIIRFVIDEAHCFSSWGQDFRVDYLYIGDFIKSMQEKKNLEDGIPVSCFTATAKQRVIEDIRDYFKQKLSLDLELFT